MLCKEEKFLTFNILLHTEAVQIFFCSTVSFSITNTLFWLSVGYAWIETVYLLFQNQALKIIKVYWYTNNIWIKCSNKFSKFQLKVKKLFFLIIQYLLHYIFIKRWICKFLRYFKINLKMNIIYIYFYVELLWHL